MRRSSRLAAVADRISADPATFASLPQPLAQRIFLALPVEARGRASCVCRAWRDTLAEPSLWARLDMSGVFRADRQHFLRVFHGRARAQLRQVDVSQHDLARGALLPVLTAHAGSLRELHLHTVSASKYGNTDDTSYIATPTVEALVAAAPLLQVLMAENVWCKWELAPRVLRAEPPYAPLQLCGTLVVRFGDDNGRVGGMERFAPFAAALADAALQPALSDLCICGADLAQPALMGALVDAAVARRLPELRLKFCTPPAATLLARLLTEGSLDALECHPTDPGTFTQHFDAAGAELVADALRVSKTLTQLRLCRVGLCFDMRVARALLGALVGHPTLRELRLSGEITAVEDRSAFGVLLAALVAADAPALQVLDCSNNSLYDAGLAPILEALPLNRHLHELDLSLNDMSEEFARERLLPAVRANTTLREFTCANFEPMPATVEAEELVRRRWQHD